jgi:putative nucleotide binding protein
MITRRQEFRHREEFARVLDYIRSGVPKKAWRREPMPYVQCIGEDFFAILEVAIVKGVGLSVGAKIYVGNGPKKEAVSVLGRIDYESLSQTAKDSLPSVLEDIVISNQEKYIGILNSMGLLTPRLHAFELLSGIGRSTTRRIIEERERGAFSSFEDFTQRTKVANPVKVIVARIVEEISTQQRYRLFVR